jgi:hypothetical protein
MPLSGTPLPYCRIPTGMFFQFRTDTGSAADLKTRDREIPVGSLAQARQDEILADTLLIEEIGRCDVDRSESVVLE